MRGRTVTVAIVGAAALAVAGTMGASVAGASVTQGATQFNTEQASSLIRGSGSDTTFFLMQKIGDLYTAAGLYGCQMVSGAGQPLAFTTTSYTAASTTAGAVTTLAVGSTKGWNAGSVGTPGTGTIATSGNPAQSFTYTGQTAASLTGVVVSGSGAATVSTGAATTGTSSTANAFQDCQSNTTDISTTDDADNWDRVEVVQGTNNVGSGAGQNQLCNAINKPVGLNVDYARSSKPSSGVTGCNEQELGYAKDGVPIVDFPSINPSTVGTSTFNNVNANAYPKGAYSTINGGNVGPVAAGWLPGDPTSGASNNGTQVTNISNVGALDSSEAFRMWCLPQSGGNPVANQIYDWGQLTNLGPNVEINVTVNGTSTVTVAASSGGTVPASIHGTDAVSNPSGSSSPITSGTSVSSTTGTTITLSAPTNVSSGTYTLVFATGPTNAATTYTGSSGAQLNSLSTLPVASTTGWPTAGGGGTIVTSGGTQTFTYTGTTGTSLLGVSYVGRLANTVSSGAAVTLTKVAAGNGEAVGIPIRIVGVNTGSGTSATFANFADGQTRDASNGCTSSSTLEDANAANDPNAATAPSNEGQGVNGHIALENNVHQLELFSQGDFSTTVDQAIEEATSLYFMSYGVYSTNPYVGQTAVGGTNYSASLIGENGQFSSAATELNNSYPTARTLSNIINSATVRSSTAGFLNWICDSNSALQKSTDLSTGLNLDQELTTQISTNFGFPRLSDTTGPVNGPSTPADNTIAPNDDCSAQFSSATTSDSGGTITTTANGGFFPSDVTTGDVQQVIVDGNTGTTYTLASTTPGSGGVASLTLSPDPGNGAHSLEFVGVPAVINSSGTP